MELNPQVVFERLFGDVQAKTNEERAARREQDRSILDSITGTLAAFKKSLPSNDRQRVEEYADSVREIERRLEIAKKATGAMENHEGIVVPAGVPDSFDEHLKLQFDLQALAYQGDITRVSTLLYARDLTGRSFPASGTNTSFHGGSHHAENPDRILDYSKINRYHVDCLAYFLNKFRNTPTATERCWITARFCTAPTWATPTSTCTRRSVHFGGRSKRPAKGGRHLSFPTKTVTTANLLLSVFESCSA
jgi:hypothetical protein